MLTRLGLGRTAVLRASATGLLAMAAAFAVGAGAWLLAADLEASAGTDLVATEAVPGAELPHVVLGRERAAAKLRALESVPDDPSANVSTADELNSSGPLMSANPGAFFRIDEAIPRPPAAEAEPTAPFWTSSPPAAAEISAPPDLIPGDRVRTTISFYYCEHDPESINPPGDGGGFCGAMRDGRVVYPGAAACEYAYLGQRFRILGDPLDRIYDCADTGSAVSGQHRDVWFQTSDEGWDWLWLTGAVATIEVVE